MQGLAQFLPLILIVVAFWFLIIRPARKRQTDMRRLQAGVEVGSEVMLGSGIYGTVTELGGETVRLEVAPGTVVTVARQAVVRVVERTEPEDTAGQDRPEDYPNVVDEQ